MDVIQRVKKRINDHNADLKRSEALTRYALIDPVLRALNWDTEDPSQVFPEFPTESGRPDYALLFEGKPLVMIEAKPLDSNLKAAKEKGFAYCWERKVRFYVITDGQFWIIYDLSKMDTVVEVDLLNEPAGVSARKLLSLWRPAMPEIEPAASSVITTLERLERKSQGIPLTGVKNMATKDRVPQEIIFPDGKRYSLKSWREILLSTVGWLNERLEDKLPIRCGPRSRRPLVSRDSVAMRAPKRVGPFFVEVDFDAKSIVKRTIWLLQNSGVDPRRVLIQFSLRH